MKTTSITFLALSALLGAACGDDSPSDGGDDDVTLPDARVDAPPVVVDAPPPDAPDVMLPEDCDYTEQIDSGNNSPSAGAFEDTGLTLTTEPVTVCGRINSDHFEPGSGTMLGTVDLDYYIFDLAQPSTVIASMTAINGSASPNLQFLVYENAENGASISAFYPRSGTSTYGAASGEFPAGTYIALAASIGEEAATENSAYRIKIAIETPGNTCAAVAGAAQYTEANDGAGNNGNDVISVAFGEGSDIIATLTNPATTPELTALTIAAGGSSKLTGTSAARPATGEFYDGDMYEFTTGATVTQGRVRLNWPVTTPAADLDFFLFEKPATAGGAPVLVAQSATADPEELLITEVKPNQAYWLWIGGYAANPTAFPKTYDIQVCGNAGFEP